MRNRELNPLDLTPDVVAPPGLEPHPALPLNRWPPDVKPNRIAAGQLVGFARQPGNHPRLRNPGIDPVVSRVVNEKLPFVRVEGPNRLVVLDSCLYLLPVEREPKAPVVSF